MRPSLLAFPVAIPMLLLALAGCPAKPPAEAARDGGTSAPAADADPEIQSVVATGAKARELPKDTGDLDAIVKRGALRVLVYGSEQALLPRAGASLQIDRALADEFAQRLGVKTQIIAVPTFADLIPMLNDGTGDLIAARMAVTEARKKQIAFSRPTTVVKEMLVGKAGNPDAPKDLAALAGKTVRVRKSSSYRETLDALATDKKAPVAVVAEDAPEEQDTFAILHDVAAGTVSYTMSDSDLFSEAQAYEEGLAPLFAVKEGRQIAWGLRTSSEKLKAAADSFLIEKALHAHALEANDGDLDAIKKRGSLRMLTRNNAVSYFLHKGNQYGFDYELLRLFAKEQGLRLDVIVPPEGKDLLPWLNAGKGDVVAAQMTVTDERKKEAHFSEPYLFVDEVIVQKAGAPPIATLADLKGKTITVRKTSSYRQTLDALAQANGFTIADAPEDQETEEIIGRVARGEVELTLADSTIASVEKAWRPDIQTSLVLKEKQPVAYATRAGNAKLQEALDAFVKKNFKGLEYNVLRKQYFEAARAASARAEEAAKDGAISKFDDLIKQRSQEYGMDWRLMAAQAYQESRFDPQAKSWVGAQGLFQVMPATGKEMGYDNLEDPDQGVHAGVQYMAKMIESFDPKIPFKHRVRFALASYNAGRGHVEDARVLAAEMGLDPNKWFGNVEKAMLLLAQPKYAKKARHGYCRGEEPVKYVSEIQSRYDNYLTVVQDNGVSSGKGN